MEIKVAEGIILAVGFLFGCGGIVMFLGDEYGKFEDWLRKVCGWNN